MNNSNIKLSDRMQLIADMIVPGKSVADVGTDHGYIPIYLYSEGICQNVILTDVAVGPLNIAKKNLLECGLNECEGLQLRIGNGLECLSEAETDYVIIAGMGGDLISDILSKDMNKSHSFENLIFQPRTHVELFRKFLDDNGFAIRREHIVNENGHLSEIMLAKPAVLCKDEYYEAFNEEADYIVPPYYLKNKEPLLKDYLNLQISRARTVIAELEKSESEDKNDKLKYWTERLELLMSKSQLI